jgi:photosynthetic reaction center cytochrome c subunit
MNIGISIGAVVAAIATGFVVFGTFHAPTTASAQHGYRGTGMDLVYHRAELVAAKANNGLPDPIDPIAKEDLAGQKSSALYKNVKVLGDLDVAEFQRLMASITAWVAPTQGCAYCHGADGNFASDALYTKVVARRMLQMTRHINADYKSHVAQVGVTCYTCHRGQPVPSYIWFDQNSPAAGMAVASSVAGDSALPSAIFKPFLDEAKEIRVNSTTALPSGDRQSIKQAEYTYGLMIHMSNALGVNCTFCHNTRAFSNWAQSTPQRVNAWYGIRMVRELNVDYLESLNGVFPAKRLGPLGDVPKVNCTTCHQGAYKPLLGASMVQTYPELTETKDVASVETPPPAPPAAAPSAAPAPTMPEPTPAPVTPPTAAAPPAPPPTAEAAPAPTTSPAASEPSDAGPQPYSAPNPDEAK